MDGRRLGEKTWVSLVMYFRAKVLFSRGNHAFQSTVWFAARVSFHDQNPTRGTSSGRFTRKCFIAPRTPWSKYERTISRNRSGVNPEPIIGRSSGEPYRSAFVSRLAPSLTRRSGPVSVIPATSHLCSAARRSSMALSFLASGARSNRGMVGRL